MSALRYLAVLPSIVRYDVLHPSKALVLRELAKSLDDPVRAVRKEVVDARYVVGLSPVDVYLTVIITEQIGVSCLLINSNGVLIHSLGSNTKDREWLCIRGSWVSTFSGSKQEKTDKSMWELRRSVKVERHNISGLPS